MEKTNAVFAVTQTTFVSPLSVGSGTAGGILAARLSEVPEWKVLLLEAGGPPPPESVIPALNVVLMQSDADWNYFTVPQKHGLFGYVNNVSIPPETRII